MKSKKQSVSYQNRQKDGLKELSLVSWNDKDPKYDIREWSPDHSKMGKGVTLTKEEIVKLRDMLNGLNP